MISKISKIKKKKPASDKPAKKKYVSNDKLEVNQQEILASLEELQLTLNRIQEHLIGPEVEKDPKPVEEKEEPVKPKSKFGFNPFRW